MQATKKVSKRVMTLALKFRKLYEKLSALGEERKDLTAELKELAIMSVPFPDGRELVLVAQTRRCFTLGNLQEILGEETAKVLWEKIPERASAWYTVTSGQ